MVSPKNIVLLEAINNKVKYKDKLEYKGADKEEPDKRKARLELVAEYEKEIRDLKASSAYYLNERYSDFSVVEELVLDNKYLTGADIGVSIIPFEGAIDFNSEGMKGFDNLKKLTLGGRITYANNLPNTLEELRITSRHFYKKNALGNFSTFPKTLKVIDIRTERNLDYEGYDYTRGYKGSLTAFKDFSNLVELDIRGNWGIEGGLDTLPDSLQIFRCENTLFAPIINDFGGNYQVWRIARLNKPIQRNVYDKSTKMWKVESVSLDNFKKELQEELDRQERNNKTTNAWGFDGAPCDPTKNPSYLLNAIRREESAKFTREKKETDGSVSKTTVNLKDATYGERYSHIRSYSDLNEQPSYVLDFEMGEKDSPTNNMIKFPKGTTDSDYSYGTNRSFGLNGTDADKTVENRTFGTDLDGTTYKYNTINKKEEVEKLTTTKSRIIG